MKKISTLATMALLLILVSIPSFAMIPKLHHPKPINSSPALMLGRGKAKVKINRPLSKPIYK